MTKNIGLSVAREKAKFFLGLGLLIALFFVSLLRQHPTTNLELATMMALTIVALLFDYSKVSQFLSSVQEQAQYPHELAVETALAETIRSPLLIRILRTELLTLYYAFFAKFERSSVKTKNTPFSYSTSSNAHDVFLFVALSQMPFLPLIHIFLEYRIGPGIAWLVTLATLWSVIWYLAQVEAVRFRPIELSNTHLEYRFGILWAASIPLSKIKMARRLDVVETLDPAELFISPIGSTKNVVLEFEGSVQFTGPYMMKKREAQAAISVDNPNDFLAHLALRGVATHLTVKRRGA